METEEQPHETAKAGGGSESAVGETSSAPERHRQPLLFNVRASLAERVGAQVFKSLPGSPGVYFFHDAAGRLLYIGQSCDLRARVGSYRHVAPDRSARRTLRLVARVARIEWRCCDTAEEAVELERVLLLEHRPPFNRAGVWPGSPWWIQLRWWSGALELRLLGTPPPVEPDPGSSPSGDAAKPLLDSVAGPLPAAFRHAHASLLRCVMRLLHPARSLERYPLGLLNRTTLQAQRLASGDGPLLGDLAGELGCFLAALVQGPCIRIEGEVEGADEVPGQAFLARLDSLSLGSTLLEQEYWRAEREAIVKYAAKRRPAVLTEGYVRERQPLPLFPDL